MIGYMSVMSIYVVIKKIIIFLKFFFVVEDSVLNFKLLWFILVFCIVVYFILDV